MLSVFFLSSCGDSWGSSLIYLKRVDPLHSFLGFYLFLWHVLMFLRMMADMLKMKPSLPDIVNLRVRG